MAKNKNKLLCRASYLKSKPKPQTVSKANENLSYPCVERNAATWEQEAGAAEAPGTTQKRRDLSCGQRHFQFPGNTGKEAFCNMKLI